MDAESELVLPNQGIWDSIEKWLKDKGCGELNNFMQGLATNSAYQTWLESELSKSTGSLPGAPEECDEVDGVVCVGTSRDEVKQTGWNVFVGFAPPLRAPLPFLHCLLLYGMAVAPQASAAWYAALSFNVVVRCDC
jgi:hypothetical protein